MASIKDSEIPTLEVGDIIYECEARFGNLEAKVTEKPTETVTEDGKKQWRWAAENTQDGSKIDYLITEGLSHYGPRIYRQPQYIKMVNGEMTWPLVGAK